MDNYRLKEARGRNDEKFQDSSKKRLMKNIERKFKTTMIGSLAKFEEEFGYLWGHDKNESNLTAEEVEWRDRWEDARTEVLNNGNNQLRAALEEIDEYTMTWNRFRTDFLITNKS